MTKTSGARAWRRRVAAGAGMLATAACWAANSAGDCKALESTDFSSTQDAPTQVMEARELAATGNAPAHCHVQGYIAPSVGFELKLPASDWNGKFIEIGCGGFCGSTRFKFMTPLCDDALQRGYACILSDQGHASSKEGGNAIDAMWAHNNIQAEIDYGFRAAHVAALAGKAITHAYYDRAPKLSYFMGCSGGGRQALVEAQRFPWDFDGVIAMDPAINMSGVLTTVLWNASAVADKDGKPVFRPTDLELLHKAVVAKCDLNDGIKDGLIGDPRICKINPAELICKAGKKTECLSPEQAVAAQKVYSGPTTSSGERLFAGGAMPGSEIGGRIGLSADQLSAESARDFFRYMAFMPDAGPRWNPRDFNFDSDYKRLGLMEMLYASDNPDLRPFKARGGKLIITQGWHDDGSPLPLSTVDYYETMEKTMGGRASTQEFARLFMIPGRAHCGRGPGGNAIDYLSYLEAWVEEGRAPDMMIAAHVESDNAADFIRAPKGPVKFARPVYPYPLQARYKGTADPNDYRNFEPVR